MAVTVFPGVSWGSIPAAGVGPGSAGPGPEVPPREPVGAYLSRLVQKEAAWRVRISWTESERKSPGAAEWALSAPPPAEAAC
ncbi:hypothetical protein Sdia_06530 [Streptomyces diastaticus subsp. diastaticus]|uniref:Uncharacterized protein n=1 Tax=Streptomyces diastaticus subsp. diastaticus TaxID=68040 RepID=A0ABQ1CHX8_STRDI|nr:hypothetical protein Sdia_06530 [Streptomyces diastaticus subsp. diastaticus]